MEIDFSAIDRIGGENAPRTSENEQSGIIIPPEPKAAPAGNSGGNMGLLQAEADKNRHEQEQARQAYAEYQHNILASEYLISEILRGIEKGESIYSLFLKACEVIARMTHDEILTRTAKAKLLDIMGAGLNQPEPYEAERIEVEERLNKLKAALERERGTDTEYNIKRGIAAHEKELERLDKCITRARAES